MLVTNPTDLSTLNRQVLYANGVHSDRVDELFLGVPLLDLMLMMSVKITVDLSNQQLDSCFDARGNTTDEG